MKTAHEMNLDSLEEMLKIDKKTKADKETILALETEINRVEELQLNKRGYERI